ncbi:MAG TPA: SGNH/GDSL hydrolase family protein [Pyrinomonadaceae bacterium]|nr:SGNH/GDSL hydrolase family protein [Pyrinomonadaceae bacterium]
MRQLILGFLFKILFVFLGIVTGLILGEFALRIVGYSYPEFYQIDLHRGYSLRPGVRGWYRKEGKSYVAINSDGLRDREHLITKPANTLRIAIIGDSFAEALQVPLELTFWSVMERQLAGCGSPAKKLEVLNFGVSGYGTAQELITLRENVWKYSPDIIILAFTTSNDITDNSKVLKKTNEVPYFIHQNDRLVLDDSFRENSTFRLRQSLLGSLGTWFRDHFRLIQAILEASRSIRLGLGSLHSPAQPEKTAVPAKPEDLELSSELGLDNLIYVEPKAPEWTEAWKVTEGLVETMHREVVARRAKFLVVTLSNGPQVAPLSESRTNFMRRFGVTDLFYPDNRIKALGIRDNFEVLTLAPEMQSYASKYNVILHGFGQDLGSGHWNEAGHQLGGDLLAQKLCGEGWLK